MKKTNLIVISAFKAESEFLIKKYKLKKITLITEYNIYTNQKSQIFVALSAIGNLNVSNLIGFLAGRKIINKYSLIFNIGVAGSKDDQLGELFRINKISALNIQNCYYPLNIVKLNINNKNLLTTDYIIDYPIDSLVDMEGYGFFAAASKYVLNEQIILLKIISDNNLAEQHHVRAEQVQKLMLRQENKIFNIINLYQDYFADYFAELVDSHEYEALLNSSKFTFSEKIMLKKLLSKLEHQNYKIDLLALTKLNSAKQILNNLELCLKKST
ncbi:MAG: hypothetical protein ACO2XZ_05050 [Rickettsiales bacterium]